MAGRLRRTTSGSNLFGGLGAPSDAGSAASSGAAGAAPASGDSRASSSSGGGGANKKSLSGFLGSTAAAGGPRRSGSATVAGDRNVAKSDDSEIYIRADGKKVRRVKRTVAKGSLSRSASDESGAASSASLSAAPDSSIAASEGLSEGVTTTQSEEIYVRPDGKKVRRVIKKTLSKKNVLDAGSSHSTTAAAAAEEASAAPASTSLAGGKAKTLAGFLGQSPAGGGRRLGGSATVAGDRVSERVSVDEGEVYIRADGKKVRRVKKTIVRTRSGELSSLAGGASAAGGDSNESSAAAATASAMPSKASAAPEKPKAAATSATAAAPAAPSTPPSKKKGPAGLGAFVEASSPRRSLKSGSATVAGSTPSRSASGGGAGSFDDGEIYVNAEGKRVRRVRKPKAGAAGSASTSGASSSDDDHDNRSKPLSQQEGEVYIRADGKKVRRVKKGSSASVAPAPTYASSGMSSAPPTAASTPAVEPSAKQPSARSSSLSGFLASSSSDSAAKAGMRKSGSATVAGDRVTEEVGEIIIRADGKKVRRIKRTVVRAAPDVLDDAPPGNASAETGTAAAAPAVAAIGAATKASVPAKSPPAVPAVATAPAKPFPAKAAASSAPAAAASTAKGDSLGSFLGMNEVARPTKSGSATVTGAPMRPEGEIYINADGKRVRRVKKSALAAATAKVQQAADAPPDSNGAATAATGAPKVAPQEGEIYIRADGKKVRRVKKSSLASLGDHLANDAGSKPPASGCAATVAGDRVVKTTDEGEIVIRADGKKVLRRKKKDSEGDKKSDGEGEVYRRADGKLVRRIKRTSAGDLAGFLDENKTNNKHTASSATVFGDQIAKRKDGGALSDLLSKPKAQPIPERPVTPATAPLSDASGHQKETPTTEIPASSAPQPQPTVSDSSVSGVTLTEDEESIAQFYRKKLKMGMPPDAIRHKMAQDGIDAKIIAAVLGDSMPATSAADTPSDAPAASYNVTLTEDEEALAQFYRKKLKVGMSSEAVRNKMVQDGVDAKIIAAVLGEGDQSQPSQEAAPSAQAASSIQLSEDDEAIAQFYRKKLKMGMPDDAVRHKMVQDGVDPRIIAAVVGGDSPSQVSTGSQEVPAASVVSLTEDEEAIAQFYRKKLKMGMPPDAVRHKMTQDEVDAKIIAAVLDGNAATAQASTPTTSSAAPAGADRLTPEEKYLVDSYLKMLKMGMPLDAVKHKMTQEGVDAKLILHVMNEAGSSLTPATASTPVSAAPTSVAYIVVVNDDENDGPQRPAPQHVAMSDSELAAIATDEHFAVKVEENEEGSTPGGGETKFMTLEQIAKITGQSKDELATMVATKRQNQEAGPRFVLQPLARSESVYEVEVPTAGSGAQQQALVLPGATMAQVKEGQEVVDSDLAQAARAVSALGDGDMAKLLAQLQAGDVGELLAKLQEAEKRQKKLEKQLAQAGVAIAEDIEYGEAKTKVEQIAKRMNEIGGSDVVASDKGEQNRLREEYFKLEQEMERYNTALMLTEEFQAEQDRVEKKWESDNAPGNLEALKKIRRHMPVKIRHMSEADLTSNPTPNGKFLPKLIAKKFKRTNVLQLLRINPDDIERMHPSTLENMRVTGLTLTERRALYWHLKPIGPRWEKNKAEKMTERKWTWYTMMKNNFKENLAPYARHCEQYGPPENHVGCPLLGKQCPIKADLLVDYNTDYGYTDADEYEISEVRKADADDPGAKAMQEALELAREKKANERADILKKHYKGKLLQVSKANGSCEAMDESMDKIEGHMMKWLEFVADRSEKLSDDDQKKEAANFMEALNEFKLAILDFAQRSGMQMSGKKKAGGDAEDQRSIVEAALSEEVYECSREMFKFIKDRIDTHEIKDTRVLKTIELLEGMMGELHGRNVNLIENGGKRPDRSRKLKKISDLRKEVEDKRKPKEEEKPPEEPAPGPMGMPSSPGGRGGLLAALQGRGRGGGRGDLLSAISGRGGRGGRGAGDGGRGGLMAALQARGAGRGGGDGGRGGLLAAIAARGGGGD